MSGRIIPDHWVYVVREPVTGCIKVGKSSTEESIKSRISALQTGCPFDLELIATFSPREHPGEDVLHKRLADWRVRNNGEWFYGADDVYAALAIRRPPSLAPIEETVNDSFDKRYVAAAAALRTLAHYRNLGLKFALLEVAK